MKPQYIEVIVAIAELGSIGAAATRLGKSQPAITTALRKAEAELGERVFHRVPHGVVPTELGKVVIDRCKRINIDLQHLDDEMSQLKGDFVGTINVVAATIASVRILPRALRQYQHNFPKIRVNVSGGQMDAAFKGLQAGDVDFVIGPLPDQVSIGGLKSIPLLESRIDVITGAKSRFRTVSDPHILKGGRWLVNGPVERRPRYYRFFENHGIIPPTPALSADSIVSILSLIEGSDNLCCVPQELLHDLEGLREVIALPLRDQIGAVTISLTSSRDRPSTQAAMAFSDYVLRQSKVARKPA